MNPTTTLTNNNPPATHECGLNPSPICREESETPQTPATELRIAIITWIERTYHRRRKQDSLGRLTPIEYETIMTTPALKAA